jgi:hypothetical protein
MSAGKFGAHPGPAEMLDGVTEPGFGVRAQQGT